MEDLNLNYEKKMIHHQRSRELVYLLHFTLPYFYSTMINDLNN